MTNKSSFVRRIIGAPFLIGILCGAVAVGTALATFRGSAVFSDIPVGSFYDQAVGEMNAAGIIKGYDATHFGPNDYVTRGQIAVLLKRLRDNLNGVVTASSSSSVSSQVSSSSSSSSSSISSSSSSSAATVANTINGSLHLTATTFTYPDLTPSLSISVVRSGGTQGTVTVKYTVSGGTAVAGVDFSANTATLTFAPGQTTQSFMVQLTKNSAATGGRTINIALSNPTGGATLIDPSSAVITLTHNGIGASSSSSSTAATSGSGGTVTFSALGFGRMENAGTATITVVRKGSTTRAVTVDYATSNGTGVAGSDFTNTSGTLSFAAGETQKTFTVSIMDNTSVDGNRTVLLSLKNPTGGVVFGTPSSSTLTIIDDEMGPDGSGTIVFPSVSFSANNHDGVAYVTVNRAGGANGTATVQYSTADDSALAGTDYVSTTGTLTFNAGEMQKQIAIPLIRHTTAQGQISFSVRINNVTGNAILGAQTQAQVTTQG